MAGRGAQSLGPTSLRGSSGQMAEGRPHEGTGRWPSTHPGQRLWRGVQPVAPGPGAPSTQCGEGTSLVPAADCAPAQQPPDSLSTLRPPGWLCAAQPVGGSRVRRFILQITPKPPPAPHPLEPRNLHLVPQSPGSEAGPAKSCLLLPEQSSAGPGSRAEPKRGTGGTRHPDVTTAPECE